MRHTNQIERIVMNFKKHFQPIKITFMIFNQACNGKPHEFFIPEWAQYVTIDKNGAVYAHKEKPYHFAEGIEWNPAKGCKKVLVAHLNCNVTNWDIFCWDTHIQKYINVHDK